LAHGKDWFGYLQNVAMLFATRDKMKNVPRPDVRDEEISGQLVRLSRQKNEENSSKMFFNIPQKDFHPSFKLALLDVLVLDGRLDLAAEVMTGDLLGIEIVVDLGEKRDSPVIAGFRLKVGGLLLSSKSLEPKWKDFLADLVRSRFSESMHWFDYYQNKAAYNDLRRQSADLGLNIPPISSLPPSPNSTIAQIREGMRQYVLRRNEEALDFDLVDRKSNA
jgi:hypothetical protein